MWIDLYTKSEGRICVLAKGIKNVKSHLHGKIELFSLIELSLEKRNSYIIKGIVAKNYFLDLRKSPEKLSFASAILEITLALLPEGYKSNQYFELLKNTLNELAISKKEILIMYAFQIKSLCLLGYLTDQKICSKCNQKFNTDLFLDCNNYSFYCKDCHQTETQNTVNLSLNTLKILNFLQKSPFSEIQKLALPTKKILDELSILITQLNIFEYRALKSFKFLQDLHEQKVLYTQHTQSPRYCLKLN